MKQYIAYIPAIVRSHSSSWGYLDTPLIATGKLFSQDQWSSLICGGKTMIHFQEQQHTYCNHFFWRKSLFFWQTEPHSRAGKELKSLQLEKRLETGSVVAARASTGLWINITKIMHMVHGCWMVYGSTSRTSYWSMFFLFPLLSSMFLEPVTSFCCESERDDSQGQPWDFNPQRHQ